MRKKRLTPEQKRVWNDRIIKHKRAVKAKAVEYKGGKCARCEGVFPYCVYDFHHIEPTAKEKRISQLNRSWPKLKLELDKCILLCSNCHRLEHWRDQE